MCSITFWPSQEGYTVGMNRDELRSRPKANPPHLVESRQTKFLSPSEPGGGTWISLNEHGLTLALINWYSVTQPASPNQNFVSRGEIIRGFAAAASMEQLNDLILQKQWNLHQPCRLFCFSPAEKSIQESQWDGKILTHISHPWKRQLWASSGFDERTATEQRTNHWKNFIREKGPLADCGEFHRSHRPNCGPFSVCMHRPDAVTVSYTEIEVTPTTGQMTYQEGSPCENAETWSGFLSLKRKRPPHQLGAF